MIYFVQPPRTEFCPLQEKSEMALQFGRCDQFRLAPFLRICEVILIRKRIGLAGIFIRISINGMVFL